MFLEKLEILGFKSFARKTSFQFNSGITGVVGPNGCGKSNIVDSIRWVLGEQKAGTLRSERMENVIFNGSKSTKPLGMAEVSMTIKNTRNVLPVEYSEVVITRRLFRSGESQYLLNNTNCRLKDITNLFMDSGMGFDAYSVIELKMVESILNGKAEDRRRIFEQAAGISKYKQRRIAAFRKLEATEKDLLRVNDITSEVQKTTDSLYRQVKKAQRYQRLQDELLGLEVKTATFQFSFILDELDPVLDNHQRLRKDYDTICAKLNLFDADIENLRTQLIQIEQKLRTAQEKLNQANRKIQQKENEVMLGRERIHAIVESNKKDNNEQIELTERLEKLKSDKNEFAEKKDQLSSDLSSAEENYEKNKVILEELESKLNAKRPYLEELEKKHLQTIEEISSLNTERERIKIRIEHQNQRYSFLGSEEEVLEKQNQETNSNYQKYEKQFSQISSDLEQKTYQREDIEIKISEYLAESESLKDLIFKNRNKIEDLENRIVLLRKVIESYEDYPDSVQHLLKENQESERFSGTLADCISVSAEYRLAIESFLGEMTACIVTEAFENALSGIENLRQVKKGFVTFLPANGSNPEINQIPNINEIKNTNGVLAHAAQIVKAAPRFETSISGLFGNCFIVENLEIARQLAHLYAKSDLVFVTLQGELVSTKGFIKGGERPAKQTGPVGRLDELRKMEESRENLIAENEDGEEKRERLNADIDRLSRNRNLLNQQIKELNQDKTKLEISLEKLKFQEEQGHEQLKKFKSEKSAIETETKSLEDKLQGTGPQIVKLEEQRIKYENELSQIRDELSLIEKDANIQANKVHEINLEFMNFKNEVNNLERELARSEQLSEEYRKTISTKQQNIESGEQLKKELEEKIELANRELESDFVLQEDLEKIVHRYEAERSEISRKVDELGRRSRGLRFDRDQTSEKIHTFELKISEMKMKAENIQQRIKEEFDCQINREPRDPEVNLDELKRTLEDTRSKLKGLGAVNLLAIEEYEKEKDRLDFLISQQKDLVEARDTLNETIEVINKTARAQFSEIYEQIRKNFKEVFNGFFPNGEADLLMAETGDVLENEIEVVANSKGKRLGSLALLSGGEKTLTAISLLFAIYLVKPSPFCILDEVDAPLDDMNIDRFVSAIKKFSGNTQFILVTHNKLTMKAADSLYGITMAGDGVSKVVSVKMDSDRDLVLAESNLA